MELESRVRDGEFLPFAPALPHTVEYVDGVPTYPGADEETKQLLRQLEKKNLETTEAQYELFAAELLKELHLMGHTAGGALIDVAARIGLTVIQALEQPQLKIDSERVGIQMHQEYICQIAEELAAMLKLVPYESPYSPTGDDLPT